MALSSEGLALFWPFLIECLAFFSNYEGLAFFEKINLATLERTAALRSCAKRYGGLAVTTLP